MKKVLTERSFYLPLVLAALLISAGVPAALAASKDVPQWGLDAAKTHTPDYAKESRAVVLFDEQVATVDNQGRATLRDRTAIRILQPQGRDDASCRIGFDVDEKVSYIHEWTIGADEKQYQAKDSDFADVGDPRVPVELSTEKVRVANTPAADPGAVVICEWEEQLAPYQQEMIWGIQDDLPRVQQAFELDLPTGQPYAIDWHRHGAIPPTQAAPDHWRWEVKDTEALDLRDVRSTLGDEALDARASIKWGNEVASGVENEWRALGSRYTDLEQHRADPTPDITNKAQELTAGAPDFYSKLKNITEYIQKNIQYFVVERGIGGWQSHFAADIFRKRYGDCKDKTALLISMLQSVGIQAYFVPVDDNRGVVDPAAPSFYGNHMITAIKLPADVQDPRLMAIAKSTDGSRYLIFDPTNETMPVGNLPAYEQGSYGILAAGANSQLLALPVLPPDANGMERKGSFTLAADGSLSGSVETSRTGYEGARLRGLLKESNEKTKNDAVEKSVARDLPGAALSSVDFVQPDGLEKPVELNYKVASPQYAKQAGPLFLVRTRVVGDDSMPFDDKPRTLPINLGESGQWHDSYDIILPDGYKVDELPDPVSVDLDFASYHSSATAKGNVLHYERDYSVRQVEIPPARYGDFRKLESAILQDEQEAAVLKKQ